MAVIPRHSVRAGICSRRRRESSAPFLLPSLTPTVSGEPLLRPCRVGSPLWPHFPTEEKFHRWGSIRCRSHPVGPNECLQSLSPCSRPGESLNPLLQSSVPYFHQSILLRRVDRGGVMMDAPLAEIVCELLADLLRAVVSNESVWKSCSSESDLEQFNEVVVLVTRSSGNLKK